MSQDSRRTLSTPEQLFGILLIIVKDFYFKVE